MGGWPALRMTAVVLALVSARAVAGAGEAGAPEATTPQPAAPPRDDPGALQPLVPGVEGVVVLASGRIYEGRVVAVWSGQVMVRVENTLVTLEEKDVRGMVTDRVPHGATGGRKQVRVILADGSVRSGVLLERTGERVVIESSTGERRELQAGEVTRVVFLREGARPVDREPRYLEAPSAFLMPPGRIQVYSREVVHLAAAMGVTPFLTVSAGSVIPGLYAEPYGGNVQVSVRGGLPLGDLLRVAGGVHLDVSSTGHAAGYLSATATFGSPGAHLTLHAGPVFPGANLLADLGRTGVALAGSLTVEPWLDAVAESWLSRGGAGLDGLAAAAGRVHLGRAAIDLGAAVSFGSGEVAPWLGLALDATFW